MALPRHIRRASSGGRSLRLGALWLAIALVIGGFSAAAFTMLNRPPDAVALCVSGTRIDASTLVLVDTTDALTEIHRRRVRAAIEVERDRLPRGGKLTVVTINVSDAGQPVEVVSACNPGKSSDANPLFATASHLDKRWTEAFGGPVEAAIARASTSAEAASSPIIMTVAALMTRPDFDARVAARRLIIISDMMEHQKGGYSQMAGGDFWKAYAASSISKRIVLDLRGVDIAIDYLMRPQYALLQGVSHRRFWQRLFTEAGASEISFIGMQPDRTPPTPTAGSPQPTPPVRKGVTP